MILAALERGLEPSDAVVIEVWPPALPYWRGWWRLHAERGRIATQVGSVPLGLSWAAVRDYALGHGARTVADVEEWDAILQHMETAYFAHEKAEQEKAPKA